MVGKKLIIFDDINLEGFTSARLGMLKSITSGEPIQIEVK